MILNETMNEIADAIREKAGKTELIAPVNFAEEIKSISAGGGESASTIEYLDVRGVSGVVRGQVLTYCIAVNAYISNFGATMAGSSLYSAKLMQEDVEDSVRAVSIDMSAAVVMSIGGNKQEMLIKDALLTNGVSQADIDSIPRITEAEFYDLNA